MLPHTSVYYLFHTKTLYSMFYAPNRYFRQSTSYSMTGFFNMSHPRLFLIYFRSFETVQILERNRRSRDSNSQPLDLSPLPPPLDQCSQNNRFTFDCVSEFIKLPKLQGPWHKLWLSWLSSCFQRQRSVVRILNTVIGKLLYRNICLLLTVLKRWKEIKRGLACPIFCFCSYLRLKIRCHSTNCQYSIT